MLEHKQRTIRFILLVLNMKWRGVVSMYDVGVRFSQTMLGSAPKLSKAVMNYRF